MDNKIQTEQSVHMVNLTEQNIELYVETDNVTVVAQEPTPLAAAIDESAPVVIAMDEGYILTTDGDSITHHGQLLGREFDNQHPIVAISGLREELDSIEALGTVYSNEYNHGDYYMWEDENIDKEDRDGYFVTMCENSSRIKICTEDDDIFGVTVASAAFVGGQADIERDYKYGLVVPIGVVPVRCEMEVDVGDYVTVNDYGVAKKTNGSFGYKVVALNDIADITFATIILSTQGDKLSDIYDKMLLMDTQMNTMEENITGAVNVANIANNKVDQLKEDIDNLSDTVGNVSGTLDGVQNDINDLWGASGSTNTSVEQLRADLETQINDASARATEAATNANAALGDVSALIKDVEPLTTWTNGEDSGATYLVEYINNGVATKAEVETASNDARNALTSVEKNALSIQSLASSISIYSVGEFSQAHGFSIDDAIATMVKGMVYVPTVDHSESYVRDILSVVDGQEEVDSDGALDGGSLEDRLVRGVITAAPVQAYDIVDYTMEFTKGYYYVWNGERWDESDSVSVFFSEAYVTGNENAHFWYTCDASVTNPGNGIVYAAETLYEWQDEHWVAVATTKHNATAKMISRVNQTTDAFSIELVNARGSTASLDVRLDDNESKISLLTQWQGTASETMAGLELQSNEQEAKINQFTTWQGETNDKITSIEQVSNEQEAKISLVVQSQDGEDSINSAGIIMAVNEDSSDLKIAAGKIQLSGITEFVRPGDLSESGKTIINGDNITTGKIKADRIELDGEAVIQAVNDNATLTIEADRLNLDGYATFTSLETSGETVINGDNITTGIIQGPEGTSSWNLATGELVVAGLDDSITTIVNGKLTTEVIESKIAHIGGWTVSNSYLYSETDTGTHFYMTSNIDNSDYWISAYDGTETSFYVDKNGILFAKGADIEGTLTATSGYIGDFEVSSEGLLYVNDGNQVEINCNYGFRVISDTVYGIGKFSVGADPEGDYFNWYVNNGKGVGLQLLGHVETASLFGTWTYGGSEIATKADLAALEAKLSGSGGGDTTCTHEGSLVYTSNDDAVSHTVSCSVCGEIIKNMEDCSIFDDGMGICERCGQSLL